MPRLCCAKTEQAGPTVQLQAVWLTITPSFGQEDLLMVTVARGKRFAIDVRQRLRMAEIARIPQRQIERNWLLVRPIRRNGEGAAQHKVDIAPAPVTVRFNSLPILLVARLT